MVNWTNNKDCSEKMWSNSSLFYATAWTFTHFTIRTLNISSYQMTLFFKLELTVLFSITFWRKRRFWVVSNASNNLKTCTNGLVSFSGTGLRQWSIQRALRHTGLHHNELQITQIISLLSFIQNVSQFLIGSNFLAD